MDTAVAPEASPGRRIAPWPRRLALWVALAACVVGLCWLCFWFGTKQIGYETKRIGYAGPQRPESVRIAHVFAGYLIRLEGDRHYYASYEPRGIHLVYGPGPYWIAGRVFYFEETEFLGNPSSEPLFDWNPNLVDTKKGFQFTDTSGARHEILLVTD